jgi:hypothetical protein
MWCHSWSAGQGKCVYTSCPSKGDPLYRASEDCARQMMWHIEASHCRSGLLPLPGAAMRRDAASPGRRQQTCSHAHKRAYSTAG